MADHAQATARSRDASKASTSASWLPRRSSTLTPNLPLDRLQDALNLSPRVQGLMQLQKMLNQSPRVQALAQATIAPPPQVAQPRVMERPREGSTRSYGIFGEDAQIKAAPTQRRPDQDDDDLLHAMGAKAEQTRRGDRRQPLGILAGEASAQLHSPALTGGKRIQFSASQARHLPNQGVYVARQPRGRTTTTLQPSSYHSDHVVQTLPLKEMPPEKLELSSLQGYFEKFLKPELVEVDKDDEALVSQYAPWWKHQVLVSEQRLRFFLEKSDAEEAGKYTGILVKLLQYPAPVLELMPEALNAPKMEEQDPIPIREWTKDEFNRLTGKKESLLSSGVKVRENAVKTLRGKDQDYKPGQGAILWEFIKEERKAIMGLVSAAIGSDGIFSLERGGSLISDLIVRLADVAHGLVSHKQAKEWMMNQKGIKIEDKSKQKKNFLENIRQFVNKIKHNKKEEIVISIVETAVGGGSVNSLLKDVQKLVSEFEKAKIDVRFKILVARETIKNVNYEGEGRLKLRDPQTMKLRNEKVESGILYPGKMETDQFSRVEMYISQLRYLIGEDVDYQLSYAGNEKQNPVIIFDESDNTLRGVSIEPARENDSAREIIIDLISGAYDSLLNQTFKGKL